MTSRTFSTLGMLAPLLSSAPSQEGALIPYTKHVLANGLEVVLHEDHAEPVVAVFLYYHVGSSREVPGKSGFAHLFEHMLFQGSEHVADDGHFKRIQEAGGTLNGTTNQDRTNYFETLPSNQLELALWLESDRMGFLLPAMTQEKLDNQRDVVKNERRQSYENRPYGMVQETLLAALFPEGHPYSWPTIGSMADLSAASLEDVTDFFRRYYGPNNATLAIGGDIDPARTLALVERYFGTIPAGPVVERPVRQPASLEESRRVVIEDRVTIPQLTLAWPTVEAGHPDEAALDLFADVVSANRSSLLDRVLIIEEQLASSVSIGHAAQERAGYLTIQVRPSPGHTLTELEARINELLAGLVGDGFDPAVLERMRTRREGGLFRSLETVASRTSRLGFDNLFFADPGRVEAEVAAHRAVTVADVLRVARKYIVERPRVSLSVVPAGQLELAAAERTPERLPPVPVVERGAAPAAGPASPFRSPNMWETRLSNGMRVLGSPYEKVPVARVSLAVPAGRLREAGQQLGLSSLVAEMLDQGTQELSPVQLTEALDAIGGDLAVRATDDEIVISMSVLEEHLARAAELLGQLVTSPRLAPEDFERVKRQRLLAIDSRGDRIRTVAGDVFDRLLWGGTHSAKAEPSAGTRATIEGLGLEDVRKFWSTLAQPGSARLTFVGAAPPIGLELMMRPLTERWTTEGPIEPVRIPVAPVTPGLYLVDKPGAAQSELRIGHPGVASTDPDYYPLTALNYVLGGSFSSRINMNLREDKGYTYGARSRFGGGLTEGSFEVSAAVHTAVTAPAVQEALKEVRGILDGVTEEEVEFARQALSQSLQRSLESAGARSLVLESIGRYGYPADYLEQRLAFLQSMTAEQLGALARKHIHPDQLVILVVGDAEKVREPLAALGLGPVHELDAYGRPLEPAGR
jgi:zinc protease